MKTVKYHAWKKISGTKPWISWPQHYPKKSSFSFLKELRGPNILKWFIDVHGDKEYVSWQKNSKVTQDSFSLADGWFQKYHRSSLPIHRDKQIEFMWSMKNKTWEKHVGLTLNQLITKYSKRNFKPFMPRRVICPTAIWMIIFKISH